MGIELIIVALAALGIGGGGYYAYRRVYKSFYVIELDGFVPVRIPKSVPHYKGQRFAEQLRGAWREVWEQLCAIYVESPPPFAPDYIEGIVAGVLPRDGFATGVNKISVSMTERPDTPAVTFYMQEWAMDLHILFRHEVYGEDNVGDLVPSSEQYYAAEKFIATLI